MKRRTFLATATATGASLVAPARAADVHRHLTDELMTEDTAAPMRHLGIEIADGFGYSMSGNISPLLATQHPDLVRKLVAYLPTIALMGTIQSVSLSFSERVA